MDKIKKQIFNWYYDLLMLLEDIFGGALELVNNHRKRILEKIFKFK